MKSESNNLNIPPGKISAVPKADTNRLKHAVRERVIKPMEERAKQQRRLVATVRARPVR